MDDIQIAFLSGSFVGSLTTASAVAACVWAARLGDGKREEKSIRTQTISTRETPEP